MTDWYQEVRRGASICKGDYAAYVKLILPPTARETSGTTRLEPYLSDIIAFCPRPLLTPALIWS